MHKEKRIGDFKTIEFVGGLITKRIESDPQKGDIVRGEVLTIPPKAISGGKIEKESLYSLQYKTDIDCNRLTQE